MKDSTAKFIVQLVDDSTPNPGVKFTRYALGQHGPEFKAPKSAKTIEGHVKPESAEDIDFLTGASESQDRDILVKQEAQVSERPEGRTSVRTDSEQARLKSAMVLPSSASLCPSKLLSALDSPNEEVAAEARAALEFYKFGQRFEILSIPVRAEGPLEFVKPNSPALDDKDVSVYLDTAEDLAALDSYKFGPRTFVDPLHHSTQPLFAREHPKGSPLCALVQDCSNRSLVFCEATAEVIKGNPYAYDRIESGKKVKGHLVRGGSVKSICKEGSHFKKPDVPNPTEETLNAAYADCQLNPDANLEVEDFYQQLFRYVQRKATTGKGHKTLIKSDLVDDVTADFVMHIKGKLEAGKFHNESPFCNWVNVCWVNFRNDELTKEGKRLEKFIQLSETNSGNELTDPEDGYQIGVQDLATAREYQRDQNRVSILEGLNIDKTSRAVAGCFEAGLNQKQTAKELGISLFLVSNAKKDIETALLTKLTIKPTADDSPIQGTVTDISASAEWQGVTKAGKEAA